MFSPPEQALRRAFFVRLSSGLSFNLNYIVTKDTYKYIADQFGLNVFCGNFESTRFRYFAECKNSDHTLVSNLDFKKTTKSLLFSGIASVGAPKDTEFSSN